MSSNASAALSSASNLERSSSYFAASGGQGLFTFLPTARVHFGVGCLARLAEEVEQLGSRRVIVITGHSIAAQTPLLKTVQNLLGERFTASYSDIRQHAPESGIQSALALAETCQADLLVSLGGGSPIDAAKIVAHRLSERRTSAGVSPVYLPQVAIPTTLSAAEFSHVAGYTDESSRSKTGIADIKATPRVVIQDPQITLWTPPDLWLSSGIRALDHAVETLYSPGDHPLNDALALQALQILFKRLPLSKAEPEDLEHRQALLLAAWMSYFAPASVPAQAGLSHTIGKRIGATYGVPHGATSCILLPPVMRHKAGLPESAACLAAASRTLGLGTEDLTDQEAALALAQAVEILVQRLGLPGRLHQVGVPQSAFADIARLTTSDPTERDAVLAILNSAW